MAEKNQEDKDSKRRPERDTSPSALSQSSAGLEWDPSADVGTSTNMLSDEASRRLLSTHFLSESNIAFQQRNNKYDDNGSEAVEGASGFHPRIVRSRSYEYQSEDHTSAYVPVYSSDTYQRQVSNTAITSQPLAPPTTAEIMDQEVEDSKPLDLRLSRTGTYSSVRTQSTQPVSTTTNQQLHERTVSNQRNQPNLLETMVLGFNYKQKLDGNIEKRPVSSESYTVSTTLRPRSYSNSHAQQTPSGVSQSKVLYSREVQTSLGGSQSKVFQSREVQTSSGESRTTLTGSTSMAIEHKGIQVSQNFTTRSHSMQDLAAYDSTTAPTATSGSMSSRYAQSSLSVDASRSKQNSHVNKIDISDSRRGIVGTDKSSISEWLEVGMTRSEIEYQKRKHASESGSSSVIWVEVDQKVDPKNSEQLNDSGMKDIAVQTRIRKDSHDLKDNASSLSQLYHSTPTERYRSRIKDREDARSVGMNQIEPDTNKKEPEKRRGRSPPKPFAVASRRSIQSRHHAHHTRVHDDIPECFDKHTSTSSSDLSPPCFLLEKMVNMDKSPIKKRDMISALEKHRDYHVKKVQHELKQLKKLNQILGQNLMRKGQLSSNSSENIQRRTKAEQDEDLKLCRNKSPIKQKSSKQTVTQHPPTSDYSSTSSTTVKDSSSHETYTISRQGSGSSEPGIQKKKMQVPECRSQEDFDKKLDNLLNTFTAIAGMLMENKENIPATKKVEPAKKSRKSTPKKKERVKPAVAYYIPFPGCNKGDIPHGKKTERTHKHRNEENIEEVQEEDSQQENEDLSCASNEFNDSGLDYNLQHAFEQHHPSFIQRVQKRVAILSRIKAEREMRTEKKREWIRKYGANTSFGVKDITAELPPKGPRLMTTREMREQTERKYKQLPEVREKVMLRKTEEEKKTNRIMSQVFANKLRQGVLKGELNVVHSRSLIRR